MNEQSEWFKNLEPVRPKKTTGKERNLIGKSAQGSLLSSHTYPISIEEGESKTKGRESGRKM